MELTSPALKDLLQSGTLAGEWVLDPSRSTVSLKNRSLGGLMPVNGVFRKVAGHGTISPAGEVSGVLTVAAASVDTNVGRRDKHLRSGDFLDVTKYPDITFTMTGAEPSGQGAAVTVTGNLAVRDRVRPLSFAATAAVHGDGEVWLDGQVRINHADFGLTWNFLGTVAAHDTLTVHAVFVRR